MYQNPLFLAKDLLQVNQIKNNQIANQGIYSTNELRNAVLRKGIPVNKNANKIIGIVEKILNFNNQRKGKGLKILHSKQMLQGLPIALAQVKPGNTSENLVN